MLNNALRDEDVRTNEGIAPRILSALLGCEQSASSSGRFTPCGRAFTCSENWVEPKLGWTLSRRENSLLPSRFVLLTVLTELSRHCFMSVK